MSSVMPVSLVGNKFVSEYYNTLIENPENITKYYTNESVMTRGNACFEDEKLNTPQQFSGLENIKVTLAHTNFKAAKLVLSGVNVQPSFGKGILIVVFGTVTLKGSESDNHPVRQFVQTFFLAPQSESAQNYVVQNDTFYYVVASQTHQPAVVAQPQQQQQQHNASASPIPTATTSHVVVTAPVVHHEPTPVQQVVEQRAAPVVPNNQQQNTNASASAPAPQTTTNAAAQTQGSSNVQATQATSAPVTENKTQANQTTPAANNTAQANGSAKSSKDRASTRRGNNNNNNNNTNNVAANNTNASTAAVSTTNNNNSSTSNGASSSSAPSSSSVQKREVSRTPSWAGVVSDGKVVVAPDQLAPPPAPLILGKKLSSGEKKNKGDKNSKGGNREKTDKNFYKNSDPETFQGEKETRSIYVSNIPFTSTVTEVKAAFDRFGKIYEVILKENGYAFINFYNKEAATKVLDAKEQVVLENRKLIVERRKATKPRDQ